MFLSLISGLYMRAPEFMLEGRKKRRFPPGFFTDEELSSDGSDSDWTPTSDAPTTRKNFKGFIDRSI